MISFPARGRRSICVGASLLALGACQAGCGGASHAHRATHGPFRTVRVSGYALTVKCTGPRNTQKPTILLLSGVTEPLTTFTFIQNRLSHSARVCSYDRPGEGTSSKPQTRQTLAASAAILHQLLAKLDVAAHGVILVGHSLGGLIAATYASRYRQTHQVKALVLLDATPPNLGPSVLRLIPPQAGGPAGQFRSWVDGFRSGQNRELLLLRGELPPPIGNIPLLVVRHGRPIFAGVTGYARQLEAIWSAGQRAWLRLSPRSRMVVARKSGHPIYLDQPALTLRLIRGVLSETPQPSG
jgi:pimeloyl-ACP methyl ester carboxylesterase